MDVQSHQSTLPASTAALYGRMEERMLARDQVGASEAFHELVRAGRSLREIVAEGVRIHAPYTHVPYHERMDDGYPNFVNNDHCLLSARAAINLTKLLPAPMAMLPTAQTVWYIPTGLDIWNQKLNRAPGHYTRGFKGEIRNPPAPVVYWPDQEPARSAAPMRERLNDWMTMVQRGQVLDAYRLFLGMMEDKPARSAVLAELCFAGMIDVQDRMFQNRSYTTGHKGYRARSTVELGNFLGWDNAHHVIYAGALDMAVGPRWYSLYEMACNIIKSEIQGEELHAVPYAGVSEAEAAALRATGELTAAEETAFVDTLVNAHSPDNLNAVTALIRAGKNPRRIVDALQVAAAEVVIASHGQHNYSMPLHCYQYMNALGWFYDTFNHPRRLRLLYIAAEFMNMTAWHQKLTKAYEVPTIGTPWTASMFNANQLADQVDEAITALDGPQSLEWTKAYLEHYGATERLIQTLAICSSKMGNDPHNQEVPQGMLEDFGKSRSPHRARILLACARLLASHRKYGDPLEAARRFGRALDIPELAA